MFTLFSFTFDFTHTSLLCQLTASVTDTSGPFLMLNPLRPLLPDETHTVLVSFTPTVGKIVSYTTVCFCVSSILNGTERLFKILQLFLSSETCRKVIFSLVSRSFKDSRTTFDFGCPFKGPGCHPRFTGGFGRK